MKRAFLILILLRVGLAQAQTSREKIGFRISAVQLSIGASVDQYKQIDQAHIARTALNPEDIAFDNSDYRATFGKRSVAPAIFTSFIISPKELSNATWLNRSHWLVGMGFFGSREMRAGYSNQSLDTTINFCNISSERSIELAYMINFFTEPKKFLYAGVGCNASVTRNNEVMIVGGKYIEDGAHPSLLIV